MHLLADRGGVGGLLDLGVGVGIAADHRDAAGHLGARFQFDAARADFALLDLVAKHRRVDVRDQHVLLAQVEHRQGVERFAVGRPVLQARFHLRAGHRHERRAGIGAADRRLERRGVRDIRRQARFEQVVQAHAAGPLAVLLVGAGVGQQVAGLGVDPVVAPGQRADPAAPADLVLQVDAHLLLHLQRVLGVVGLLDRLGAVDRIEGVQRGGVKAHAHRVVVARALVVETGQQGVRQRAGVELVLGLVVDREHARVLARRVGVAVQGGQAAGREAQQAHRRMVHVGPVHARVLAQGELAVDAVREQVAERLGVLFVAVEAGLAAIEAGADLAVGVGQQGALGRQEAAPAARARALQHGQHGQAGVGTGVPGQRRRQQVAPVVAVVAGRAAVARQADHAVQQLAVFGQRAGEIAGQFLAVVGAVGQAQFMRGLGLWPLAHGVDEAAGRQGAVHHRGRAFEHLDAFQRIGFVAGVGRPRPVGQRQPVQVLGGGEAAHPDPVAARVLAVGGGHHAGGVAQRFVDARGALQFDLVAGHHRHRLRGLQQVAVGLDAGGGAARHRAVDRAGGGFLAAGDGDLLQLLHRRGGLARHHHGAAVDAGGQAAARQHPLEGLAHRQVAGDGGRRQALHQRAAGDQVQARLARQRVERLAQRLRRQSGLDAGIRRGGLGLRGAGQRQPERQGQGRESEAGVLHASPRLNMRMETLLM
ncbi:Uncharacterised protein [Achromobacter sp. 2789STDY5608621]|nr:Uncharacterised protein [Achromobacter sp. 2789STDY5608621]